MIINERELSDCLSGQIADPHSFLGVNPLEKRNHWVARVIDTHASEVLLLKKSSGESIRMKKISEKGFFEVEFKDVGIVSEYSFLSKYENIEREWLDPYSFEPFIGSHDLNSFNSGTDRRPYEKLGSIPVTHNGVPGVSFVVWAPMAKSVHIIGDFNLWNPISLPMRSLGASGCRELFVPFAKIGDKYKYRILGADGIIRDKTDPYAIKFEPPLGNASIVQCRQAGDKPRYDTSKDPREIPLSIYEIHLGSWKWHSRENRPLSYLELAEELPDYLVEMGFSHVEFLPPSEYPFGASWGYQVTGYYAPTFRYGRPEDFLFLINSLKDAGIGVLVDWVPGHFPTDEFSLSRFDGTCLYEHEDPRQGQHAEWGTLCYNYGRPEVKSFLIGSAIAWLERYGIDGFRVDAVASMLYLDYGRKEDGWIPNKYGGNHNLEAIDFIKDFNRAIHEEFSHVISIAEESTAFPKITQPPYLDGLGFDFKWNMGWMNDVLRYFSASNDTRSANHHKLTFGAVYQFSENFVQSFSHDEVVHGKGSLVNKMNCPEEADRIANLRTLLALQWMWPGKKSLFMGCEFAQLREWDFDSSLDWELLEKPLHKGISRLVKDLNSMYLTHPTWAESDHISEKFKWIDCDDSEGQTLSFIRSGGQQDETLLVICNFSNQKRYREWGCPHPGMWHVILDTDSPKYQGMENEEFSSFRAIEKQSCGQEYSLLLSVPRWSVRILSQKSDLIPH